MTEPTEQTDVANVASVANATTPPLSSAAVVRTDRGGRYAKQLAAHLGRRLETSWDESRDEGVVAFPDGRCDLRADNEGLRLTAHTDPSLAPSDATELLGRIEDVVGRHLVRFGARDELVVQWRRSDGSAGSLHRNDDDPTDA